jgi:hypothetical protein
MSIKSLNGPRLSFYFSLAYTKIKHHGRFFFRLLKRHHPSAFTCDDDFKKEKIIKRRRATGQKRLGVVPPLTWLITSPYVTIGICFLLLFASDGSPTPRAPKFRSIRKLENGSLVMLMSTL